MRMMEGSVSKVSEDQNMWGVNAKPGVSIGWCLQLTTEGF